MPATSKGGGSSSSTASNQPLYDPQRDIYIAPYPLLGLECCENGRHAISCGGGGAAGKKEIPNEIHLHAIDGSHPDKKMRFTTLDRMNMGSVLPTKVTYSAKQDLWCVSAGPKGYVLEITEDEKMKVVHEFKSEVKPVPNRYTGGEDPGCQELMILCEGYLLTAGTDGVAKVWSYPDWKNTPLVEFGGHTKQIEAMDVSPDEKIYARPRARTAHNRLVATVSEDRSCCVWRIDTGEQVSKIVWNDPDVQQPSPMTLKFPHFLTEDSVLLSAAGPRGPAMLGIWKAAKEPKCAIQVNTDPKPCSALRINLQKNRMMCGFVQGHKNLYSLDVAGYRAGLMPFKKLEMCGSAKKPIHQLAVQCVAFSGPATALSASGDYTVHLGPGSAGDRGAKAGASSTSGGTCSCGSACCCLFLFLTFLVLFAGLFVKNVNEMSPANLTELAQWVETNAVTRQQQLDDIVAEEFSELSDAASKKKSPGASAQRRKKPRGYYDEDNNKRGGPGRPRTGPGKGSGRSPRSAAGGAPPPAAGHDRAEL
ncbi:unnamed protein product [Amoebophrya sp. A120]|nr:unnamed protein product [Amoebophrya sp. A120]|eukprot:GSA120T00020164001.1